MRKLIMIIIKIILLIFNLIIIIKLYNIEFYNQIFILLLLIIFLVNLLKI